MKSEGQVKQKLKQVLWRHMKKHLSASLKQVPENCRYNREPGKRVHGEFKPLHGEGPRMCIHAEQAGVICDGKSIHTLDFTQCPFFTPSKSKDQLKAEFVELARSPRDKVAETMPDAAALMWVLDQENGVPEAQAEAAANSESAPEVESEDTPKEEDGDEDDEEPAVEQETALTDWKPTPWWKFWEWGFWPWNRKNDA